MRLMLPPPLAMASVAPFSSSGVSSGPMTVTTCGRRYSVGSSSTSSISIWRFRLNPNRSRSFKASSSSGVTPMSTSSVSRRRTTTCSTSRTVAPRPASTPNRSADMPGASGPLTLTRTVLVSLTYSTVPPHPRPHGQHRAAPPIPPHSFGSFGASRFGFHATMARRGPARASDTWPGAGPDAGDLGMTFPPAGAPLGGRARRDIASGLHRPVRSEVR